MTKTVVISGGGSGIGLATARYFAERGAQVAIIGRRKSVLEDAAAAIAREFPQAPNVLVIAGDLGNAPEVEAIKADLSDRLTTLDVLVNAAGGHVLRQFPAETYADGLAGVARRWNDNFRNNTLAAVLLTEALLPQLRSPGGRIILLSSIAAYRGSGNGCYGGAKAALHPYCFDLAKSLGGKGITVNAIAPGYVSETGFFGTALSDALHQAKIAETMNGRAGIPADIAHTIGWLASAEAAHITGQIIQVNGGAERGR
ncbi:SDR family NAD(P)-dependent oxidoreductase [Agrobacterium sp. DKPNP3]|uniref:SDR family NAD(P)-dependent oxidoreductase n=1 Tax=Agrobacterium sp. DKPNP3 TaxID=3457323 RepID=UPI004043DD37